MHCEHAVVIFFQLSLFLRIANGDGCYMAQFSEDVSSCPDFDNQMLKCENLKLGMVEGKEADLGLNGLINLTKPIVEEMKMEVQIWKILDIANEFMYGIEFDTCEHIEDKSSPIYPLMESMKVHECPVNPKTYPIKDMILDLSHSAALMTPSMCGEYLIRACMFISINEKMSCHEMGVTVSQQSC